MLALPRAWVQYVIEELKALKQRSLAKIYIYIYIRGVREGFTDKVISDQRPEGSESMSHTFACGEELAFLSEEIARAKLLNT